VAPSKSAFDHLIFLERVQKDASLAELRKALADVIAHHDIDLEKISTEIGSFAIDLPVSFTKEPVGRVNEVLAKVQSYKDRLAELKKEVITAIYFYDRLYTQATDHIRLSYSEVRELQSEELRKAIIAEALREFETPRARAHFAEELIKVGADNLTSKNDNASRQLSVIQEQIKLGELQARQGNLK
jgi:hypothetical protein